MSFSAYVVIPQVTATRKRTDAFISIGQTGGSAELEQFIPVAGPFELDRPRLAFADYEDPSGFTSTGTIEVYRETRALYNNGNVLLKYLPAEYEVQDVNDDLKQLLQVVAIQLDEFYNFVEDFTTLFDPDRCPAKYLPYLARLINYPLNTRGFDSPIPSIQEAAVSRGRRQLRTAVEVYKRKGLKEAFQILFYGLGYYIELVELWTNNYITFFDAVPVGESLYHPISNPNGWFKSPYFGVKLVSLGQQTIWTTGGEGQPWSFTAEDLQEILEALHSVRPVHTVLWYLNYYFDLTERVASWVEVPGISDVAWVPEDRMEYVVCDLDDPLYYRNDERLVGVVREFIPQADPTKAGPTVTLARLKRQQERGICHPGEWLEAEFGEFSFEEDTVGGPIYRDGGQQYRDGFATYARDGSMPTREPSAFEGRNGGYWRDAPLAPHDADGTLVPDRSGVYFYYDQIRPLYQIAEEVDDGVIRYYNPTEFKQWLDTMVVGVGPDPELAPSAPYMAFLSEHGSITSPQSVSGNAQIVVGDDLWSLFGGTNHIFRLSFVSGLPNSITDIVPAGYNLRGGAAATYDDKLLYFGGTVFDGETYTPFQSVLVFDPSDNSVTLGAWALGLNNAAHAQIGAHLYLLTDTYQDDPFYDVNLVSYDTTRSSTPFLSHHPAVTAINEFLYVYCGDTGETYRYNTITKTWIELERAPLLTSQPILFATDTALYILSATATGWSNHAGATSAQTLSIGTGHWSMRRINLGFSGSIAQLLLKAGRFYGLGAVAGQPGSSALQVLNF